MTSVQARDLMQLPVPPVPLIGRDEERARLLARLTDERVRLITLTGPPGVGKTLLAQHVAWDLRDAFADGSAFVSLAALDDVQLVPSALARGLGVPELDRRAAEERLIDVLREQHLLLILDNFEHVLEAAPLVSRLLTACPRLSVLATSRERLQLRGEQQVPVAPLPLPAPDPGLTLAALTDHAATRLFLERSGPGWEARFLGEEAPALVAEVCALLDGLPLAIELVAPHLRVFSLRELRDRLRHPLDLARSGLRDAPARQRTLRAAIGWSYALLTAPEQRLLRQLGSFAGGCMREAVLAVCATDGGTPELEDALAALVNKSLVQASDEPTGERRFGLLRTVREFALEQLSASGEREDAAQRHASYFAALAEEAAPHLLRTEQCEWLDRLEQGLDNLRAVLDWCLAQGQVEPALALAAHLLWYWVFRGAFSEGRYWLETALAHSAAAVPSRARARALTAAGALAWFQSDIATAQARIEQSIALCRKLAAMHELAQALAFYALAATYRGDTATAVVASLESLPLFRAVQDTWGVAWSYHILSSTAMLQMPPDWDVSHGYAEESLAGFREAGDRCSIAMVLGMCGQIALLRGEISHASALVTDMQTLMRELGFAWGRAMATNVTVLVARRQGQLMAHTELYEEALRELLPLGEKLASGLCIAGLAGLYRERGDPVRAARLLGAAGAWLEDVGTGMDVWPHPIIQADYDRDIAALRTALGEQAFVAAAAAGRRMARDAVFAEAFAMTAELSTLHAPDQPLGRAPASADPGGAALTVREVEVLTLLARGMSAPEIAQVLTISRATTQRHIANLYAKIGARGRVDAVAYAFARGLVTPTSAPS